MRTHLRRDQPGILSSDQGDENIEFLSTVQTLTQSTQLATGGVYYQPSGNLRHDLPSGAHARVTLVVGGGTATIAASVDETPNPVYQGGTHIFMRAEGRWRDVALTAKTPETPTSTASPLYVARTLGGALTDRLTWMLNAAPVTLALPETAPAGTVYGVKRGAALVSVIVSGSGTMLGVDQTTGQIVRRSEARLTARHRLAEFVRVGGEWRASE